MILLISPLHWAQSSITNSTWVVLGFCRKYDLFSPPHFIYDFNFQSHLGGKIKRIISLHLFVNRKMVNEWLFRSPLDSRYHSTKKQIPLLFKHKAKACFYEVSKGSYMVTRGPLI